MKAFVIVFQGYLVLKHTRAYPNVISSAMSHMAADDNATEPATENNFLEYFCPKLLKTHQRGAV